MATDQGPIVQSALLRGELVRLRVDSGLTQKQVAEILDWSQSKLMRIEGGGSRLTQVDLDALLDRYGATSESRREQLHVLNRGAKKPRWWNRYKADVPTAHLNYVGFEAIAFKDVRAISKTVVGGKKKITLEVTDPRWGTVRTETKTVTLP